MSNQTENQLRDTIEEMDGLSQEGFTQIAAMANKKSPSQHAEADAMRPTSNLPFAARACDLPYLDELENWRYKVVEKLSTPGGGQLDRAVDFAQDMAAFAQRISDMDAILSSAEDYMNLAYRGGPSAAIPVANFMRGMTLLGLARELLESAVSAADASTERYCDPKAGTS